MNPLLEEHEISTGTGASAPLTLPGEMRRFPFLLPPLVLLLALLSAPTAAHAEGVSLVGMLTLVEKGAPVSDAADAVVWFVPVDGAVRLAPVRAEVQMRDRRFSPRVTVVPAGSEVWFPNSDPILHNVFSVSPGNRFDLGLYRQGSGKAARIEKPGLVRVYCNVHHAMSAYVLALDTPFVVRPGADGRFSLEGLPLGAGTLHVWHERASLMSRTITLPLQESLALTLELRAAGPVEHLDKQGKPYRESRSNDEYR